MKTLAVIGASYLQLPLVRKAKEMGLRTICFAWENGAVCRDEADAFYPVSIVEKEKILEICRREGIDGVCTIASDVAAPTVAYVASALGLPSNSLDAAVAANNKYAMRCRFRDAGVPCPAFLVSSEGESADEVLTRIGASFPLIVKPTDRSGSLCVNRVDSPEQLDKALACARNASFEKKAMVEEYVDGREISVEFISCRGKHYPLAITDKQTTGAPHFVELAHHQPSTLPPELYEYIYSITEKALDALGVTDGASHSEYKVDGNGRVFIIELGARMGGDFIGSNLVRLSTGYDFLKGVIEVALGEFTEPVFGRRACSGVYFLCRETERLLPLFRNPETCPEIVECVMLDDGELKNISCSADRSGYAIYRSDKRLEL